VNYENERRKAVERAEAQRIADIIKDAFAPLFDELKRKPAFWEDFGFKSSDPDELGVKPVEGHVTGEQLQNIMDQTWRALGVKRYTAAYWPDPDKRYLVTGVAFSATEEGQC
jgi:hypothetical protein